MANLVLPSKYADALYKAAVETNSLNSVAEELRSIKNIIDTTPNFRNILMHPGISKSEKTGMIKIIFGDKVTKLSLRLMLLLIEKKREPIFDSICDIFLSKFDEASGFKKITIETAFPLEEKEKAKLISQLEKAMDKKLIVDTKVNPEILGGIIIRERMKQIDASVLQFLRSMRGEMAGAKLPEKNRPAKKTAPKKEAAEKAEAKKDVKKPSAKKPAPKKKKK